MIWLGGVCKVKTDRLYWDNSLMPVLKWVVWGRRRHGVIVRVREGVEMMFQIILTIGFV